MRSFSRMVEIQRKLQATDSNNQDHLKRVLPDYGGCILIFWILLADSLGNENSNAFGNRRGANM